MFSGGYIFQNSIFVSKSLQSRIISFEINESALILTCADIVATRTYHTIGRYIYEYLFPNFGGYSRDKYFKITSKRIQYVYVSISEGIDEIIHFVT